MVICFVTNLQFGRVSVEMFISAPRGFSWVFLTMAGGSTSKTAHSQGWQAVTDGQLGGLSGLLAGGYFL